MSRSPAPRPRIWNVGGTGPSPGREGPVRISLLDLRLVARLPIGNQFGGPGVFGPVEVDPDAAGMPGAELIQQVLGWLSQLALWGSLASILVGAAVYGLAQNAGNYNGAFRGKQLAVAGAIGACLTGLAPTAINLLFDAAAS